MELVLVRHGATDDNAGGTVTGQDDPPLSDAGIRQARRAGRVLRRRGIDAAYSSDLERAVRTVACIVGDDGPRIRQDPVFREQDFGWFTGRPKADWRRWLDRQDVGRWRARPPGGETMRTAADRVLDGMTGIRREHPDDRVLVGAHGVVITAVLMALLDLDADWYDRLSVANTGITELRWDGCWRIASVNETGHLG